MGCAAAVSRHDSPNVNAASAMVGDFSLLLVDCEALGIRIWERLWVAIRRLAQDFDGGNAERREEDGPSVEINGKLFDKYGGCLGPAEPKAPGGTGEVQPKKSSVLRMVGTIDDDSDVAVGAKRILAEIGGDARRIVRGRRDREIAEGAEVAIEVTEHLIAGQNEGGIVAGGIGGRSEETAAAKDAQVVGLGNGARDVVIAAIGIFCNCQAGSGPVGGDA